MEITSRIIESQDLGQLHVSRFVPPNASNGDLGFYFGGVNSRVTTIDTFGAAYILASERNIIVDVIDRPGNGLSTMPESDGLRSDYMRFGFIAVRDAIVDVQRSDDVFNKASRLHAFGMSLGGHVAVQYLQGENERASSVVLLDSAGLRLRASECSAIGRYFLYLGIEFIADSLGKKPGIAELFEEDPALLSDYEKFMYQNPYLSGFTKQDGSGKSEFYELRRLASGKGVDILRILLQDAVDDNRHFEVRASRSGARVISDRRSPRAINKMLSDFDVSNPGVNQPGSPVRYGFSQDGPWWHSLAVSPNAIRRLVRTPINQLQRRLK